MKAAAPKPTRSPKLAAIATPHRTPGARKEETDESDGAVRRIADITNSTNIMDVGGPPPDRIARKGVNYVESGTQRVTIEAKETAV